MQTWLQSSIGEQETGQTQGSYSSVQQRNQVWSSVIEQLVDPSADMSEEERAEYEKKIMQKLQSGKRLSAEEMQYLQLHNPAMYRTALRVKAAKDRLKEQLKHCRSKQEVQDTISQAVGGISDSDPDKAYLTAGLQETAKNFKKDFHYARLPETTEQAERKRKNKTGGDFDDGENEDEKFYTPIQEVLDSLPQFDVVQ